MRTMDDNATKCPLCDTVLIIRNGERSFRFTKHDELGWCEAMTKHRIDTLLRLVRSNAEDAARERLVARRAVDEVRRLRQAIEDIAQTPEQAEVIAERTIAWVPPPRNDDLAIRLMTLSPDDAIKMADEVSAVAGAVR